MKIYFAPFQKRKVTFLADKWEWALFPPSKEPLGKVLSVKLFVKAKVTFENNKTKYLLSFSEPSKPIPILIKTPNLILMVNVKLGQFDLKFHILQTLYKFCFIFTFYKFYFSSNMKEFFKTCVFLINLNISLKTIKRGSKVT